MSESEGRGKGAPLASGRQSRGTGFAENLARVRRKPDRARYDTAAVHAVLDAAPFCHVATVRHGRPVVLPMVHGRVGDMLVLHGSAAAGLFRHNRRATPVRVTATPFDPPGLARSPPNPPVNYP